MLCLNPDSPIVNLSFELKPSQFNPSNAILLHFNIVYLIGLVNSQQTLKHNHLFIIIIRPALFLKLRIYYIIL